MTTDQQVDRDDRTVVVRREYPDPIGDVWAALTESDRLARWLGHYTGAGGPGGTVEFTMTGEVDAGGEVAPPAVVTILECEPPRRLVVDFPESADRVWRVAVTLSAEAGRTVLRFEQQLVEGLDAADVEAGWSWYLDRLGASLHGGPMPRWADYAPGGRDRDDGLGHHVDAVRRRVGVRRTDAGSARVVTLSRAFDAAVDEVWDACTNAERIPRWFLPVTGELRIGGRYRIEGMGVGGVVRRCDPPRSFAVTWEQGDEVSELASEPSGAVASPGDDRAQRGRALSAVEVLVEPAPDGGTLLTLEHVGHDDDAFWERFGPGATGVGWDMVLLGLAGHLGAAGVPTPDEAAAWSGAEEGKAYAARSSDAWYAAHVAGGADADAARAAAGRTTAFYTGVDPAGSAS